MKMKTNDGFKKAVSFLTALVITLVLALSVTLFVGCDVKDDAQSESVSQQQTFSNGQSDSSGKQFAQPSNGGYYQGHDD